MQYKDCQIDCDPHIQGNNCNSGLDAISAKFEDPDQKVDSCYVCNITEALDGTVNGQVACRDVITGSGGIESMSCPAYASVSCFHAASFHQDYSAEITNEFEEDYRGYVKL
jgi:hypothetical protein